MTRQEKTLAKKRGRPATGQGTTVGVRCHDNLLIAIDEWRRKEPDHPTRAAAIRRLAEQVLLSKKAGGRRGATATKSASDLAETAIDRLADTAAPGHAQAGRKRRLLQGPKEFREMRAKARKPKSAT